MERAQNHARGAGLWPSVICAVLLITAGCSDKTQGQGGGAFCENKVDFNGSTYRSVATDETGHGLPEVPARGRLLGQAETLCADGPRRVDAHSVKGVPPDDAIYVESYGGAMVIDDLG